MADVRFTRIWEDRSDNRGFRFEFRCERCHSAYSSSTIPGDPRMPGARDRALGLAVEQMERDVFLPCATCRQWVCGPRCWNHPARSCTTCRPATQPSHAGYQGVPPQGHQPARPQPQSRPAATEAWAPDMQAELRSMLSEEPQQRAAAQSRSGQGATEAWAPDMQSELRSMLNETPAARHRAHGAPPPAELPKFCNQCGSPLTGRFCGRCGHPAY